MSARRFAVAAAALWVLAALLWWLSRDVVTILPPPLDPPVEGLVEQTVNDPGLLLLATICAGIAMVLSTLAAVRSGAGRER